jgi:hypothetical protein
MTTIEIEMNETAPTFEKRLKDHPELRSRFESIISIAEGKSEGPDTADEIEERTIAALNQLGKEVIEGWASKKAAREVLEHKNKHPDSRIHKKNNVLAHYLWPSLSRRNYSRRVRKNSQAFSVYFRNSPSFM